MALDLFRQSVTIHKAQQTEKPGSKLPEGASVGCVQGEIPTGLGGYVVSPWFFCTTDIACSSAIDQLA
jgi:hypothetical protein